MLSIASKGSVASIGSVGSAFSVGSIGSGGSALSVGSVGSFGSMLSAGSCSSVMSAGMSRGVMGSRSRAPMPLLVVAILAAVAVLVGYGPSARRLRGS